MPWECTLEEVGNQRIENSLSNLLKGLQGASGWSHTADGVFSEDELVPKGPATSGPSTAWKGSLEDMSIFQAQAISLKNLPSFLS